MRPVSASPFRSRTSSSTSRPSRTTSESRVSNRLRQGTGEACAGRSTTFLDEVDEQLGVGLGDLALLDDGAHDARLVALDDLLVGVDDRIEQVLLVGFDGLAVGELVGRYRTTP